jgi:hypothetical protein
MERHHISRRIRDGYTREDVMALIGVSRPTVAGWIRSGLLALRDDRITESSLRRLIFAHPELYSLRKVDEWLFKSIVFSGAEVYLGPCVSRSARVYRERERFGFDRAQAVEEARARA